MTHATYAYSLAKMVLKTTQSRIIFNGSETTPEIEIFLRHSTVLPNGRNTLVKEALDWGANYLLWVDSDHSFPDTSLLRLLSLNLPVVGVNQARRSTPTSPMAVGLDGNLIWTTEEMARAEEITAVSGMGLNLCLIDATVFGTIHRHALENGRDNFWPLFAFEPVPGSPESKGEDYYFFRLLSEAGIPAYVDHALSWSVLHMHQKALSNADTIAQKDDFLAKPEA